MQGQERRVIIISTVRSTVEYVQSDTMLNIGFLNNPKRFNVAITRAKALVIVIGNPAVLATDPSWGKLLWYCADHRSYKGVALPTRPHPTGTEQDDNNDEDALSNMLQQLHLQSTANEEQDELDTSTTLNNEQSWTQEE